MIINTVRHITESFRKDKYFFQYVVTFLGEYKCLNSGFVFVFDMHFYNIRLKYNRNIV